MASRATTRARSSTRNHKGIRDFAPEFDRAQEYADVMTDQVRRGYRNTKKMIRRHPAATSVLLIAGCGLVAGVLVGLAMKSRLTSRRPFVPSPEALAKFLTSWQR